MSDAKILYYIYTHCRFLWRLTIYNIIHLSTHTFLYADGFVIIECEEPGTGHATGQVILDYLTDTVVNKKASVKGSPLVSPDSRVVVSIDKAADGVTLVVQQVLGGCYQLKNRTPGVHMKLWCWIVNFNLN